MTGMEAEHVGVVGGVQAELARMKGEPCYRGVTLVRDLASEVPF